MRGRGMHAAGTSIESYFHWQHHEAGKTVTDGVTDEVVEAARCSAVRSVINCGADRNSLFDQNINASVGELSFDIGDFFFS